MITSIQNMEQMENFLLQTFFNSKKYLENMASGKHRDYRGLHPVKVAEMYQQETGVKDFAHLLLHNINPDKYHYDEPLSPLLLKQKRSKNS